MPLTRGHHSFDDHYTQVPNAWLRDSRLSLKAIGLLAQIMSHTPGWKMSIRSLARFNNCGIDTIKSAILELEKYNYLKRSEKQKHNEDGTFADFEFITCDPFQNPAAGFPRDMVSEHKEEQVIKKNNVKEDLAQKAKRSKSAPFALPDGWQPKPKTRDKFGTKWVKIEYESTLEAFIEFSLAKGSKWVDWDLAFQSWCRKAEGWAKPGPVHTMSREESEIQDLLKRAKR